MWEDRGTNGLVESAESSAGNGDEVLQSQRLLSIGSKTAQGSRGQEVLTWRHQCLGQWRWFSGTVMV